MGWGTWLLKIGGGTWLGFASFVFVEPDGAGARANGPPNQHSMNDTLQVKQAAYREGEASVHGGHGREEQGGDRGDLHVFSLGCCCRSGRESGSSRLAFGLRWGGRVDRSWRCVYVSGWSSESISGTAAGQGFAAAAALS